MDFPSQRDFILIKSQTSMTDLLRKSENPKVILVPHVSDMGDHINCLCLIHDLLGRPNQ